MSYTSEATIWSNPWRNFLVETINKSWLVFILLLINFQNIKLLDPLHASNQLQIDLPITIPLCRLILRLWETECILVDDSLHVSDFWSHCLFARYLPQFHTISFTFYKNILSWQLSKVPVTISRAKWIAYEWKYIKCLTFFKVKRVAFWFSNWHKISSFCERDK